MSQAFGFKCNLYRYEKGAIGIVQKIVKEMQVPGAMEAVQAEVQANIIEEAKVGLYKPLEPALNV